MPTKDSDLLDKIANASISGPLKSNFLEFADCYVQLSVDQDTDKDEALDVMQELFDSVEQQTSNPYLFSSLHIPSEEDHSYFELGLKVARPLVLNTPEIINQHILQHVQQLLHQGENVIFAANHQTELEPQILSIACDSVAKDLFKNTFFVAGERVTTDPMAAPLSRGRRLFCIYAKRYVSDDKQIEIDRRMHNLKTIKQMKELLNRGGVCIYVALGGGRDRPDESKNVQLTPFDPSSVGLFTLLAQTAKQPTHIYPLVISSFNVLPPPVLVQKELGERRWTRGGKVTVALGEEFSYAPFLKIEDKEVMHQELTNALFNKLKELYTPYIGDVAPASREK